MTAASRPTFRRLASAAFAAALLAVLPEGGALAQAANPFGQLVGKWGGSGLMTLEGGRKERLSCDAQYSGTALQLVLTIKCRGGENQIDMRARLSSNAGRLLGMWEERHFNVVGTVSGTASENRIDFDVIGILQGKMTVNYTRSRQKVSISVRGAPLQTVTMDLRRR